MKKITILVWILSTAILTVFTLPSFADSSNKKVNNESANQKNYILMEDADTIKLTKILDAVSQNTNQKFMVNAKAKSQVVAYGVDLKTISYNDLLLILQNNEMGVVEIDGYINIIALENIKQSPIPVITEQSKIENDALWVSKVVPVGHLNPSMLLPMLRIIIPTNGHFAQSSESNSLLVIAPYNVIKKIESIIDTLEIESNKLTKSTKSS